MANSFGLRRKFRALWDVEVGAAVRRSLLELDSVDVVADDFDVSAIAQHGSQAVAAFDTFVDSQESTHQIWWR
ncbi:hypothetical protein HLK59_16365 [Streptomyces sp. S3(2020)]|uniref:hypothetical protein n=1 Tax=Streptomyces sp. S3(2020) TaxID=2732044 RepID=UPI00148A0662|nr:hypothetical protein [Streptomyces sp. S3(2020)]NNN31909.1 hypothetical protein [Streptomyces sp. S3(2020)]